MAKLYGTPGPRAIWPSVARSRQLAACSLGARLLFDRLISQADDQGRLEGDPILVRAACMPLDAEASLQAIKRWLGELEAAGRTAEEPGLIVRYEHDGQALVQLSKWWTYQSGQKRIYASRWPGPDGWPDDRIKFTDDPRKGKHAPKAGDAPEDAPSDGAGDRAGDGAGDAPEDAPGDGADPVPARAGFRAVAVASTSTTTPQPPTSGGRRTRARDLGPMRSPTRYDALLESDDDVAGEVPAWMAEPSEAVS